MEDIFKEGYLEEILPTIREAAGNTPLLFTFRTKKEGGNMAASLLQYKDLVKKAICSSLVDLVDIEPVSYTHLLMLQDLRSLLSLLLPPQIPCGFP